MDNMTPQRKKRITTIMYICFGIAGMISVSVGSLLPLIRQFRGVDYKLAGVVVSSYAAGNLLSCILFGYTAEKTGIKAAILIYDLLFPVSYVMILVFNGAYMMIAAFFFAGIARGACSNCCNKVVSTLNPGNAAALNGLHAAFSVGAFLFPVLLAYVTHIDASYWIYPCILMAVLGCLSIFLFTVCPMTEDYTGKEVTSTAAASRYGFFKEQIFWTTTMALFFYLCAEQGVIGWMVTYFTDTGYISAELSELTASILWIMIMAGRFFTAFISRKTDKKKFLPVMGFGFAFFFIVLLFVRNAAGIILLVMCIGFFAAGIFPTTLSFAGELGKTYPLSFSYILTISSLGAVLMPTVIGHVADKAGIIYGMGTITIAVVIEIICIVLLCNTSREH